MTKFAVFTEEGFPAGFYAEDVHGPRMVNDIQNPDCLIPLEAIEITECQWQEFINNSGYRKWINGDVAAYEPPAPEPVLPNRISSRQFFLQLDRMDSTTNPGIYLLVSNWVALQDRSVRIAFDKADTFLRTDEMLQQGFDALGFTTEQVDAFFTAASAL